MVNEKNEKHNFQFPTARKIRRACNRELYRTVKRLKMWIPPEQMEAAEDLYFKKVAAHVQWITENGSNRKALADWWEEHVCPEIAELWNVEAPKLAMAFREAFGG